MALAFSGSRGALRCSCSGRPARCSPAAVVCRATQQQQQAHLGGWQTAAAAAAAALLVGCGPALADLNVLEAEAGGEFGRGSAMQYGEADIQGRNFAGEVRGAQRACAAGATADAPPPCRCRSCAVAPADCQH